MPALSTMVLFGAAALALLLIPGPSVLYIVTRSVSQGRRAGLVSALGMGTGNLCHVTAATLGLSALVVSSALAFSAVKYAGAAYLVCLGLRTLLSGAEKRDGGRVAVTRLRRVYSQALFVDMLNPKTAIFFLAFLPQFVDRTRGPVAAQVLVLGCLFVLLGICSDSCYALVAGTLGARLKGSAGFARSQRYVAGTVYIGLGLTTALTGSRRT